MTTRRALLAGIGTVALSAGLAGAYGLGAFREATRQTRRRLATRASLIPSSVGPLEYAVVGDGPPFMMIHGTGGGFDQGLLFGEATRRRGFSIVAPSRFGYLGSAFPDDASPTHQADVLVELLDHLQIDRLAVAGGSAGALTAAEFGLRHPDRCSHLVLLVPAMNLSGRDPVEFTAFQRRLVGAVLGSDAVFWALSALAPGQMLGTLLATDPALLDGVGAEERLRAETILAELMPVSRKGDGLRMDGFWAGTPCQTAVERITVPTLILSCEDDRFGTAATARTLHDRIPDARLVVYPDGGHIWLGHDEDVADEIAAFLAKAKREG
ncbi:MAG: alpha/beta hydrolase [Maritimibacter sp.]|nr:alpha/beta hydrolase [Maritimibacter sp.]